MRRSLVLAGLLLVVAGTVAAQEDFPKIETAPTFMYIHTSPLLGGNQGFNCVGGGGTLAYNFTSMLGIAADLGGCKLINLNNTFFPAGSFTGNEFTFLFGPRITFRNFGKFQPFAEVNLGGVRAGLTCSNSSTVCVPGGSYSRTAFGMTAGGGFDYKLNKKFAIRVIQAEYLYTRFGNNCNNLDVPVCNTSNSQNSFRLKSGIVIGW
jgi:opacity protein-like surface antigen